MLSAVRFAYLSRASRCLSPGSLPAAGTRDPGLSLVSYR
jgi:hypothetical protein